MRRRVRIFISKGEAKILQVKPFIDDLLPSIYQVYLKMPEKAQELLQNRFGRGDQVCPRGYDFVLPMAESTENEINASGEQFLKEIKWSDGSAKLSWKQSK